MFSLKTLFFFILGINCLFLVAFFLSVRTPDVMTPNVIAVTKRDEPKSSIADSEKKAESTTDNSVTPAPKHAKKTDEEADASLINIRDTTLEAMNGVIQNATNKIQEAEAKVNDTLKRRDQVRKVLRYNNPFHNLGAYPKVLDQYFNSYPDGRPYYEKFNYGVINDNDYCELVDTYNLAHPENMFKQMNFFTDYAKNGLVRRDVIRQIGKDKMRQVSRYMPKEKFNTASFHLDPSITNFFSKRVDLHIYHRIGEDFNCATQMYNHIPGHGVLKRKDLIVDSVAQYAKIYQDQKLDHCFNNRTFFPFSFRLYIESECKEFFDKINSQAYKDSLKVEPMQYLIKLGYGAHRANGVFLLDTKYTDDMNKLYDFGNKCGYYNKSIIAQTYITDPLLLDLDNKFDFRVYMLVASTNPLMVYYHDGFLRVSLNTYNKKSEDRNVHLTNTHLSKDAFAEAEKTNMTLANELREYQMWTFDRLADYLVSSGKVKDKNANHWLDSYLRPAFKKAFIHATRMSAHAFWNESNVYEMFGLDFMLDDELNLWFIECNSSPQLIGTNERKSKFLIQMLTDLFEIEYGLYRSRMKRVLQVLSNMNIHAIKNGGVDYEIFKKQYAAAVKNRFEPEYEPKKDNSFKLIMDMNLSGPQAYFGNIPDECANDDY